MVRSFLLCMILAGAVLADDPFVPLDFNAPAAAPDQAGARAEWVKVTNQRMAMAGKTLRVATAGPDGLTAVVLAPGVDKPRHAKPILTGKGDNAALFKSVAGLGFTRMVVRNPDSGKEWGARLEKGKAVLED
jgi:hypothetical protein